MLSYDPLLAIIGIAESTTSSMRCSVPRPARGHREEDFGGGDANGGRG